MFIEKEDVEEIIRLYDMAHKGRVGIRSPYSDHLTAEDKATTTKQWMNQDGTFSFAIGSARDVSFNYGDIANYVKLTEALINDIKNGYKQDVLANNLHLLSENLLSDAWEEIKERL